jgi:hypothetical protein
MPKVAHRRFPAVPAPTAAKSGTQDSHMLCQFCEKQPVFGRMIMVVLPLGRGKRTVDEYQLCSNCLHYLDRFIPNEF